MWLNVTGPRACRHPFNRYSGGCAEGRYAREGRLGRTVPPSCDRFVADTRNFTGTHKAADPLDGRTNTVSQRFLILVARSGKRLPTSLNLPAHQLSLCRCAENAAQHRCREIMEVGTVISR